MAWKGSSPSAPTAVVMIEAVLVKLKITKKVGAAWVAGLKLATPLSSLWLTSCCACITQKTFPIHWDVG